jgi:4-aminobutyrate aminotransferase-like enzyme
VLAPTYRLFYEEPLHVVRAQGVWMYGADGRAYLDAYNNVPVAGHCHPYIVERLGQQAATLNTHTRYLTEEPVALAERLLTMLPPELDKVTFTCSGSDANDLAIRVCKAATGGTGMIVTEFAYHGTTELLAGLSPSIGLAAGADVYHVAAPVGAEAAAAFGSRIRQCLERMRADGVKPAALLVDTIFSSDGVAAHPAGFLRAAAEEVRAAGGLFIADEVQPGFGRTGEALWGFARHGVVPDVVTMGKPMGNGHPIAAMVARADVLAEFASRTRYFNTFGGINVSCAVALAVLEVIEREQLMQNARDVGEYLQQGLRELAGRHAVLRDVRGAGLFIGVDIARNPASGLDARAETSRIVNGLRREGVLISSAGRNADVLKIRPPLPFGRAEADFLLDKLDHVLRRST